MAVPSEDDCPVSDSLLASLYRSSPEGLPVLVATVPIGTRAMLAYFCSRRAHLEPLGLAIASTCSPEELYDVAGRAGWSLFERAQAGTLPEPSRSKRHRGITLACGPLRLYSDTSQD
jgi:hypothetical protein